MDTADPAPRFSVLRITDWRQFEELSIEFHPQLTILTGANATGKSTLLDVLARHFDWSRTYSTAPIGRGRRLRWSIFGRLRSRRIAGSASAADVLPGEQSVGLLTYDNGVDTPIIVRAGPSEARSQYDVQLPQQQRVIGVFLTSHRSVAGNYAPVASIPTSFGSSDQVFEQFTNEVRTRWLGSWTGKSPQAAFKEALISAAVFGEGSRSVDRNEEAYSVWTGFQQILAVIFPRSLGYLRLRVRVPDIIVETQTGEFVLDEASGGMSALMEMAWQIFLRSQVHERFTVLLDEPENHLHPSLQRDILPNLMQAFPGVQFVVATHSPFVVTATPESTVYVLDYGEHQRVVARRLDYVNKAAGADETLRRVLGLESTMPTWAEERFQTILDEHLSAEVSPERLVTLRKALEASGLQSEFPTAMIEAATRTQDEPPEA